MCFKPGVLASGVGRVLSSPFGIVTIARTFDIDYLIVEFASVPCTVVQVAVFILLACATAILGIKPFCDPIRLNG